MAETRALVDAKRVVRNLLRIFAPTLLAYRVRRKWNREAEIALLPALCDRHRVSFDVGANWGQYSGALKDISLSVVACEPVPALAQFLRRTLGGAIQTQQVALSNRTGTGNFILEVDWGRSRLNRADTLARARTVAVKLETVDSLATSPVGFIKVDVEGHEEQVIEGALKVVDRDHPVLLIEIEERHRPGALGRILTMLRSRGYLAFFLLDGEVQPISRFNPTVHQNNAHAPYSSNNGSNEGPGCYINNFLFIHESAVAEKQRRLAELGYSVAHMIAELT